MFLLLYFGVLVLVMAVAAGVLSWYWAVAIGVAMFVAERKLLSASHITDGDHASDEHGQFRDPVVNGPATGPQHPQPHAH